MPAFTWSSGMIRVFAGITTAERVNDAKQTARSDEIALRSITTIPGVDSVQRSPFALRQLPPVHRAGTRPEGRFGRHGVRDCCNVSGFTTSSRPLAPDQVTQGGFILPENQADEAFCSLPF